MAFQRIILSFLVIILFTFSVEAGVIDFYGKQYINFDMGELMTVMIADTIHAELPLSLEVKGLMGVSSLSYLDTEDGKIDFLITMASKNVKDFLMGQGYLYDECGKLLLKGVNPIHLTAGEDRATFILQIPANLIEDAGKYYFQIYLPQKDTLELFLSWPILVGE